MCRLGLELVPAEMTNDERAYAKRAIEEYKQIRPIVQQGDLYRLISPYEGEKNSASLMYVNSDKSRAVLFAYHIYFNINEQSQIIRLQGLKADAKYRIREVSPENLGHPVALDGEVISGSTLMNEGVIIPELTNRYKSKEQTSDIRQTNDYKSVVLELVEVK
jgi:alpha-galactosidase